MPAVLLLVAGVFAWVYWTNAAVPRGEGSAGWMAWHDQTLYVRSAKAMLQGDLTPEKHWYPPLYPAMGAALVGWSPAHAFLPINLLALLWFSFVFIRFSDQYLPRWGGVCVLAAALLFNTRIVEHFIIPWTTNLTDALLASGLLGLVWTREVARGVRGRLSWWRIAFVALCLGLIVPTRPADSVVGMVIGMGFVWGLVRAAKTGARHLPAWPLVVAALSLALVGPVLLWVFNMLVFAEAKGDYVTRHALGFFPETLPVQLFSFWIDAGPIYGRHGVALLERQPWLLFSVPGLVWILIRGDASLRWVGLSVCALFGTYLSFAYIMPGSLWKFMTIHYFKWSLPYLGLFGVVLLVAVAGAWRRGVGRLLPTCVLVAGIILPLSMRIEVNHHPIRVQETAGQELGLRCELPAMPVSFIDFSGLVPPSKFIARKELQVSVDGRPLVWLSDFKAIGLDGGTRLLFTTPVTGSVLEIGAGGTNLAATGEVAAVAGRGVLSFGWPALDRELSDSRIANAYKLGEKIDFAIGEQGVEFAGEGWSPPEVWGRWSEEGRAMLKLRLVGGTEGPLTLRLGMKGFVREEHPTQRLRIVINGIEVARTELRWPPAIEPDCFDFPVPDEALAEGGVLSIVLEIPDATSPHAMGEGDDARKLGIGLLSLQILPRPR